MEELMVTVSGNGVNVVSSGDAAPQEEAAADPVPAPYTETDSLSIVQAIQAQTAAIETGFIVVYMFLGLIAGISWMKGFWIGKD